MRITDSDPDHPQKFNRLFLGPIHTSGNCFMQIRSLFGLFYVHMHTMRTDRVNHSQLWHVKGAHSARFPQSIVISVISLCC